MATQIRPEVSKKSKYWIPRHRYYELKHFVMQYPLWTTKVKYIDSMVRGSTNGVKYRSDFDDHVLKAVELREEYLNNINMVNKAAKDTDPVIGTYILQAVVNNESYEKLNARATVPCCKDVYYELYRKFFWILDSARK